MKQYILITSLFFSGIFYSCKKFVDVGVPHTELFSSAVFSSDPLATAVVLDIYSQMSFNGFASGDQAVSMSYLSTYSADEMVIGASSNSLIEAAREYLSNEITIANAHILKQWTDLYQYIYKSNVIIEALTDPSKNSVSESLKNHLLGEALFIRGFSFFYLVNLWGDCPLTITTDYKRNATIGRSPVTDVYNQIVDDLQKAEGLMSEDYSFSSNERVRANKWVASALLARVYLYLENWVKAEQYSTKVIENSSMYSLTQLNEVFRKNSSEAIWQLHNTKAPNDWSTFYIAQSPLAGFLRQEVLDNFETNDNRRNIWVKIATGGVTDYPYCSKYEGTSSGPVTDYSTILRLSEQFLIRAEARAKQGKLSGLNSAETDMNIIRNRAGLGDISFASEAEFMSALQRERLSELFCEWGHRWLDLKRWGRADAVLAPIKGPGWQPTDVLYPIPEYQRLNSPAVSQNPGYPN